MFLSVDGEHSRYAMFNFIELVRTHTVVVKCHMTYTMLMPNINRLPQSVCSHEWMSFCSHTLISYSSKVVHF